VLYKPGGWYKVTDVLQAHHMQRCTLEELRELVEQSVSVRFHEHRFEMREEDGELYVRARYGWSFDAEHPFDPDELPAESEELPRKLSTLCLDLIVKDIKCYEDLPLVADSYVVEQVFERLKQQKKLNNAMLKIFCTESTEALDFSGLAVADTTLTKVTKSCPNLVDLNLSGCLCVTDHVLRMIAAKCQSLRILNVSKCPNITKDGLCELAQRLPNLGALVARHTVDADDAFRERLAALLPQATRIEL
jgi:hypothetical protein